MRVATLVRLGLLSSVGLLALMVAEPVVASAAPGGGNVACTQTALVGAVAAANASGGGTINLTAGCTYSLTAADNPGNGLPAVTSQIGVNGNGATIDGTKAVRVFEVDGPGGNLTLNNVTVTGGSADIGGGIESPAAR